MENFYMSTRTKWLSLFLSPLFLILFTGSHAAFAKSVELYTPYTKISVPPGESIDYTVDVINNSSGIKNVAISLSGMPKGWTYTMKSGGWTVEQLAIMPGEKKSISLKVEVPLKIDKGNYHFNVVAGGYDVLPLHVVVSEKGTFKTEFTTDQANMEGAANSTFTFNAKLKNSTAEKQLYSLRANAPRGWNVDFKAKYKQVTSVNVEANSTENITIEVHPPDKIAAGKYKIPVRAGTASTSADLDLEVVVTGSYEMELSTPTGLLSTDITAGNDKRVELVVRNTGSAALQDIKMDFKAPVNWDVTFDPKTIDQLEAGGSAKVFATIKAYNKAIAGDYVTNLTAKTPETSSTASFRISVKTSMVWGWLGIFVIFMALGSVYSLFKKYGRR